MAAHGKRIICKAMRQIVESTTTKPSDRIKAARMYYKVRYSASRGKPRGRHAQKTRITSLDDILNRLQ